MSTPTVSLTARERAVAGAVLLTLSAGGIAGLLLFWDQVLPSDDFTSLSLPVVALVAAVASAFNPCSLPALPGFLAAAGAVGEDVAPRRRVELSVAASAGAAAVVVLLGLLVAAAGSKTKDLVEPRFRWVQLAIGVVLVVVAALHLAGRTSRLPLVGSLTRLGDRVWANTMAKPSWQASFGWGAGFVAIGAG
jgi:cytochrome c biogenesis protein CcdA